jgi:hypothetical protein
VRWILAALLLASPAHAAELVVDCKDMDFLALRAALDAELADHPGTALTVTVTCPERDAATVHVEGRRERRVDLRDVPPRCDRAWSR